LLHLADVLGVQNTGRTMRAEQQNSNKILYSIYANFPRRKPYFGTHNTSICSRLRASRASFR
jgi:hypothetical protein